MFWYTVVNAGDSRRNVKENSIEMKALRSMCEVRLVDKISVM